MTLRWRSLKTAPKDGRWIDGETPGGKVVRCRWIGEDERDSEYGSHEWGRGSMRVRLKRWRPAVNGEEKKR